LFRNAPGVARKAFFLTNPNRWCPVEVHTALPPLHWLPKAAYRSLLAMRVFRPRKLNLLSAISDVSSHLFPISAHRIPTRCCAGEQ
jgi:hypothetical protein